MRTQTASEAEELQSVLSSEAFSEAPIMARLLKYLGEHHFGEKKYHLNEYRIGIEALGRSPDFDPSKNSCVRVEMHRLRARLRKYYETEGADHTFRILLMEGRYGLRFEQTDDGAAALRAEVEEPGISHVEPEFRLAQAAAIEEPPFNAIDVEEPQAGDVRAVSKVWMFVVAAGFVVLGLFVWAMTSGRFPRKSLPMPGAQSLSVAGAVPGAMAKNAPVLILAGHPNGEYIDRDGRAWGGDRYFNGGQPVTLKLPYIQGTADPIIYQDAREGEFSYDIPLASGKYELRLHFVETTFGPGTFAGRGESSRVFSVLLNDQPILKNFDILSDAGGNFRAFARVFKGVSPGSDGMIHLKFRRGFDQPRINAIELEPQLARGMNPVRIVMQENSYVDRSGQKWLSDQYAIGGLLAAHQNQVVNGADPHLYNGERFGHFTYQIPVAAGHYTLTLHFTEAFFGSESPRRDGAPRVFDVYANGAALLRGFDILEKAGEPNKVVTETFHGIEPNAAGVIALSFVPARDYACVSAIEVTDESR
jgi:hypothetical protein